MIIQINGIDHNTHRENPSITIGAMKHCPLCGRVLCRNGWYTRCVRALQCLYFTVIYRKLCTLCRISFTLLPHFLLPRHCHVKSTIVSWLKACALAGLSCLEFLKPLTDYRAEIHTGGKGHSFSDYLRSEKVYPGTSLLSYWLISFSHRAALFIPELLDYCIQAGRDLRKLESICDGWVTPLSARPLAYSFALCRLLYPALSEDALFEQLAGFLLKI